MKLKWDIRNEICIMKLTPVLFINTCVKLCEGMYTYIIVKIRKQIFDVILQESPSYDQTLPDIISDINT